MAGQNKYTVASYAMINTSNLKVNRKFYVLFNFLIRNSKWLLQFVFRMKNGSMQQN